MSYATLIFGKSGTGKTCSLRNLDPKKTLLIQPIRKPLPFPSKGWTETPKEGDRKNIIVSRDPGKIVLIMQKTQADIIVIDDFQYLLSYLYFENIFGKDQFTVFKKIGDVGFRILSVAPELATHKRVYVLCHSETSDRGETGIKTLGKMLKEKLTPEGLFTTALETSIRNGNYGFLTQNDGTSIVKAPMGLFSEGFIENDLNAVDTAICNYYGIEK